MLIFRKDLDTKARSLNMANNRYSSIRRPPRYRKKQQNEWGGALLFYVLPFLVLNGLIFFCVTSQPKIEVEIADTRDYVVTEVTLTVKSFFPTKNIQLSLDDEKLELIKGKKRTYTAAITKNGTLEASVTNINGMSVILYEHANVLDDLPPNVDYTSNGDGIVFVTVTDSQSGVDFDSIYAVDSTGQRVEPLTLDRSANAVSYEIDPAGLHVFAKDKAGNEVQRNFTSHKEGDVETLESDSSADDNTDSGVDISFE